MLMKAQRLLVALTLVNLSVLILTLAAARPAVARDAPEAPPVLRGRGLEIVDDEGRVRASISVIPAGTSANGDPYPQTVLLRLITERGRPSVKISTSEEAAGLMLAGPTNTKRTWVQMEARGAASSLTLKNEDGRERAVVP
jgi:hypothetical protein